MTSPTAPGGIRAGIRCTAVQPISAGHDSVARPEVARSEDENTRKLAWGRIGICRGKSQGLHYYADQHIQWPNSSWAAINRPAAQNTGNGRRRRCR
jgi:hypothetical protein